MYALGSSAILNLPMLWTPEASNSPLSYLTAPPIQCVALKQPRSIFRTSVLSLAGRFWFVPAGGDPSTLDTRSWPYHRYRYRTPPFPSLEARPRRETSSLVVYR